MCLATSLLIVGVLLYLKPERPPAAYWALLGVTSLSSAIFTLLLPFMAKAANVSTLPENLSMYVIAGLVGAFWLLAASLLVGAVLRAKFGMALLLGVFLLGATNVLRDLIKELRKRRASRGPK